MDEKQLAELECHLAAGTDLPTAMAAVEYDAGQRPSKALQVALLIGLAIGVLLWLFK